MLRAIGANEADAQLLPAACGFHPLRQRARCARTPSFSAGIARASPVCGATRSPAICRSCCCGSRTPRISSLVRQLVQAHAYWRLQGLAVDLVILDEEPRLPADSPCTNQSTKLIAASRRCRWRSTGPAASSCVAAEQIAEDDRILLQTVARVVLSAADGTLAAAARTTLRGAAADAPRRYARAPERDAARRQRSNCRTATSSSPTASAGSRRMDANTSSRSRPDSTTPAPWVNVLANPQFGTRRLARAAAPTPGARTRTSSASRRGTTTRSAIRAARRSTCATRRPAAFWSPTPLPSGGAGAVRRRATASATASSSTSRTASHPSSRVYVAIDAPVKFVGAQAAQSLGPRAPALASPATSNGCWATCARRRRCTSSPSSTRTPARCSRATRTTPSSPTRVAFFDVDDADARRVTGDRAEFLGRNGTLRNPAAMRARAAVRHASAPALDPCAAIQVAVRSAPTARRARSSSGSAPARSADEARELVQRFRGIGGRARRARRGAARYWQHTLGAVQVRDARPGARRARQRLAALPDAGVPPVGAQRRSTSRAARSASATSCRTRWRWSTPSRSSLREHLLRCASRQFVEGDVQHWWHPPPGRGVRTHCSDDYLWLPFATCRYVARDRRHRRARRAGRLPRRPRRSTTTRSRTTTCPRASDEAASLYEHCVRAIEHGLRFGAHGLPLMGSRRLERRHEPRRRRAARAKASGSASSCTTVLTQFGELARAARRRRVRRRAAQREAARLRAQHRAARLGRRLVPPRLLRRRLAARLGGERRVPDRFDRAELVGAVRRGRSASARARRWTRSIAHLVRRDAALVQLLDPPFDHSSPNPGYITGLRARRARERRPVHARRGLGGDGVRRARRRASARGSSFDDDQPGQPRANAGRDRASTRSSRTWSPPTSTRSRRTPAAAAGRGTPARPAGCTG